MWVWQGPPRSSSVALRVRASWSPRKRPFGCTSPRAASRFATTPHPPLPARRIVERGTSPTAALRHERDRAPTGPHSGSSPRCSMVRTKTDPSIARARAVTRLRNPARAPRLTTIVVPSLAASHPLEHVPMQRSRWRLTFLARPVVVAPSPAARASDWHVRREAPNAARRRTRESA